MRISLNGIGPEHIFAFMLVMGRMGAIMAIAPLYSGRGMPMQIRVVLAVAVTIITLPLAIKQPQALAGINIGGFAVLLVKEIMVGLAIGLAATAIVAAWQIAGSILDLMIGFSYGGVIDPLTGNQTPVVQQLYGMLALMIFISLNGDHWVLAALHKSYQLIPLASFPPVADFGTLISGLIVGVMMAGIGVAAPVMIALFVTDVAFGLVSRAAPQTQIMQVEFPVKIAVGLAVIIASLPFMVPVFAHHMERFFLTMFGTG